MPTIGRALVNRLGAKRASLIAKRENSARVGPLDRLRCEVSGAIAINLSCFQKPLEPERTAKSVLFRSASPCRAWHPLAPYRWHSAETPAAFEINNMAFAVSTSGLVYAEISSPRDDRRSRSQLGKSLYAYSTRK